MSPTTQEQRKALAQYPPEMILKADEEIELKATEGMRQLFSPTLAEVKSADLVAKFSDEQVVKLLAYLVAKGSKNISLSALRDLLREL